MNRQTDTNTQLHDDQQQQRQPKLVIGDFFDLRAVSQDSVITLRTITIEEAARLVTTALYGEEGERGQVINAVTDHLICDRLNEAKCFGMAFTWQYPTWHDLHEDDTVILVDLKLKPKPAISFKRLDIAVRIDEEEAKRMKATIEHEDHAGEDAGGDDDLVSDAAH